MVGSGPHGSTIGYRREAMIDEATELEKAWAEVSKATNEAGWSDDWFSEDDDHPSSTMTWAEYICYHISLTKKD